MKSEEEKLEPESKKPKKDVTPSTRENGGQLGGLPLYGEQLPELGYETIPPAAKMTCEKLHHVMERVKELKSHPKTTSDEERNITAEHKSGLLLFAKLRKLNRLSNLYCKDVREKTHERKLGVDELHLQLQNLHYEAMHLQKEITNCLEFKSKHEDIELINEDDFFNFAPESISRPDVTKTDSHKLMLARLEWELEQRKQLASQLSSLEKSIKEKQEQKQKLEDKLSSLQPSLERLRAATVPLQEFFQMPLDWEREQYQLATYLPLPLYMFYVQAEGYSKAYDKLIKVAVVGDKEEAKSFQVTRQYTPEDSDSDQDGSHDHVRSKKKKKRSKSSVLDDPPFTKAFPLSVNLTITNEDQTSIVISFHHLPYFCVTCASVTSIKHNDSFSDSEKNLFIEKTSFLHCLFEGDSGRTSPNAAVSYQIRKYGGDNFSTAVRQYGFPFKWVQRACGIIVPVDPGIGNDSEIKPDNDIAAENITELIKVVKNRLKAQICLTKQLSILEQLKLSQDPGVVSQLIRWRSLTLQEVQSSQFGGISIFNLQERMNRFFLATFQYGQARMHAIVCVTPDYPSIKPVIAVLVEVIEKQREPYDIQIKNIESEVNIYYPRQLSIDKHGKNLLIAQMKHVQFCLDSYVQFRNSQDGIQKSFSTLSSPRGKGRLLSFQSTS